MRKRTGQKYWEFPQNIGKSLENSGNGSKILVNRSKKEGILKNLKKSPSIKK